MKSRTERHLEIRKIVSRHPVRTQADLRRRLLRRGISVNQGTLSRDVRQMGLVKVSDGNGGYRYAPLDEIPLPPHPPSEAFAAQVVRSAEAVKNLIVVKTEPGGASPFGLAVDRLRWPEVAGTVAGDDTLLVVARENSLARKVARRIEGMRG